MKNDTVLIVDDLEINREILAALFEKDYRVLQASEGEEAMDMISRHKDELAVILLDLIMPKKDGFEVLDFMRFNRYKKDIPVILISAADGDNAEEQALRKGADDFITKPFSGSVVRQRVSNMIELYRYKRSLEDMISVQTAKFKDVSQFVIDVLMTVMQVKNRDSRASILRVRGYTKALLDFLASYGDDYYGMSPEQVNLIVTASVLHDIGEIAVPESIFLKQPVLNAEEQAILESHTIKGCEIIRSMENMENGEYIEMALEICRWHHERWDGSGYPDRLVGNDIPVSAQVVGIADTYETLRTGQLTGLKFSHEAAMTAIEKGDYGSFSPVLTESWKLIEPDIVRIHDQFADASALDISGAGA